MVITIIRRGGPLDGGEEQLELAADDLLPVLAGYWPCFAADGPGEGRQAERDAEGCYIYLPFDGAGRPPWYREQLADWPEL